MRTVSAKDTKSGFGRLIDLTRAESVAVSKRGRSVIVAMEFGEYKRLTKRALADDSVSRDSPHRGED
jgi:hypothetical protein